jgi:hypothetical protein
VVHGARLAMGPGMMNKKLSVLCGAALLSLATTACKKSDDKPADKPADPVAKAEPKPATPPPAAKLKTCADYGGTGKGDFGDECRVKGPAPFDVVVTSDYKEDFGEQRPLVKITSHFDHALDWGSVTIWYYDKDGNALPLKSDDGKTDLGKNWNMNGSGVLDVKPGETIDVAVGVKKGSEPPGTVKMEAEVTGWGYDGVDSSDEAAKGALFFDPHADVEDISYDSRPQGGWKPGATAAAPAAPTP